MPNRIVWTKQEIDLLVKTVETNGCLGQLAATLNRTPTAVASKAARLRLKGKATADT
jgi:hypothetical protein